MGGNLDAIKAAEDEEARQKLEDEQRAAHNTAVEKANKSIKDLEPRLKKRKAELDKLKKAANKAKMLRKVNLRVTSKLFLQKLNNWMPNFQRLN